MTNRFVKGLYFSDLFMHKWMANKNGSKSNLKKD